MASRDKFLYGFVRWRDLPGPLAGKWPPETTEMESGGHFPYRFLCCRALSRPPAGKWPPEATFRIDLYAGGAIWEMASGDYFSYGFARWRDLPGPPARKWPPEATFRIDLHVGETSLGHLLGNGIRRPLLVCVHWLRPLIV